MDKNGQLFNKIVIVTGAASGIGRASALYFASEGATVIALDKDEDGLSHTVTEIKTDNGIIHPFIVNMMEARQVESTLNQIINNVGQINGVFNVVGGSGRHKGDGPVHQCTLEGWEFTLQLNLMSMFYVCKYAVQHMLNAGNGGAIVNLSSVLGMIGHADFATHAYAASKGAIISMSRAMAVNYAPNHIRVNVLAPGLIDTAMSQRAQENTQIMSALANLQPLTGKLGQPQNIATAACFLLSDPAQFITGCVLPVDGGWTAQ